MIAVEVIVNGEESVFVNPAEYIFEDYKHFGYVLNYRLPDIETFKQFKCGEDI